MTSPRVTVVSACRVSKKNRRLQRATASGRLLPAAFEAASVHYRRVSPVAPNPCEGLLTEPTPAVRPWSRERVFMPHCPLQAFGAADGGGNRPALRTSPRKGEVKWQPPIYDTGTPAPSDSGIAPNGARHPSVFHVMTFKTHASKMTTYPLMSIVRIQWVANILSRYRLCEPCGSFDSSACQRPHSSVVSMIASAWQPRFPAILWLPKI